MNLNKGDEAGWDPKRIMISIPEEKSPDPAPINSKKNSPMHSCQSSYCETPSDDDSYVEIPRD